MNKTTTRRALVATLLALGAGAGHADALQSMTPDQHRGVIMVTSCCGFEPSTELARHLLARPEMAKYTAQVADHRAALPNLDTAACARIALR